MSRGAHLEQIGTNEWRLTGDATAYVSREEVQGELSMKWVVKVNMKRCGAWGTCSLALSQAYAIATGRGADAARQSTRGG